jgi:alginate O-acetyltransferase complex protein AlgI
VDARATLGYRRQALEFNSIDFVIFFSLVTTIFFLLPHRFRWMWLLAASCFFYMRWNASYIILLFISAGIDYFCAIYVDTHDDPKKRRWALGVSMAVNVTMIFTFKYWSFFHHSMKAMLGLVGFVYEVPDLDVILPVGISFYTFQAMSYTVDVFRKEMKPERHIGRYLLFITFFPHLVAGPIMRAPKLLPQFLPEKFWDWPRAANGLQLMMWGLFKKVVIGDRLALYVDAVYNNVPHHDGLTFLLATYAFAFQIYCDFSGYSDIAIGAAQFMGFELPRNFDRPYFSKTITEFWRRWHISLSSWLRDYLYIPLGGNRGTTFQTYKNLMITMVLGGLWHGASWNFVIWGGLQGVMLAISRATLPARDAFWKKTAMPPFLMNAVRMFITFHLVCLSWVFFRANTLADAVAILRGVFEPAEQLYLTGLPSGALACMVLVAIQVVQETRGSVRALLAPRPLPVRWLAWYALAFAVVLFGNEAGVQFIYFQF